MYVVKSMSPQKLSMMVAVLLNAISSLAFMSIPPLTPQVDSLVEVKIKDIKASNIPKLKRTLYGSRRIRVVCSVSGDEPPSQHRTGWGKHSQEMQWSGDVLSFITRKSVSLSLEIYGEHRSSDGEKIDIDLERVSITHVLEQMAVKKPVPLNLQSPSSTSSISCSISVHLVDSGTVQQVQDHVDAEASQRQKLAGVRDIFKALLGMGTAVSELNTFAKTGFACVNVLVTVFDKPFQTDESVGKLLDVVHSTLQRVRNGDFYSEQNLTQDQRHTSILMMRQINECLAFINTYTRQSYWKLAVKGVFKNYLSIIEEFIANMNKMNAEFDLDGRIVTEALVYRVANTVGEIDKKMELDTLKIAEGADYNPDKACLNDTRVDILQTIRIWINGSGEYAEARAFLLLGQAGVGKSAIAHTIAKEWKLSERLGASFCFAKDRGADNFFRTIARRLADLDAAYASRLAAATARDSSLKTTPVISLQIEDLVIKPFQSLSVLGTIVIVIDALDECYEDRIDIIQQLNDHIDSIPQNIRFLITSRPSEAQDLSELPWVTSHHLEADDATNSDIYTFVEHQLRHKITKKTLEGFGKPEFEGIVAASQGVFQYATVVCKEIMNAAESRWEAPSAVYDRLVKHGSHGLDVLYSGILANAYGITADSLSNPTVSFRLLHVRKVLGWVLNAKGRLSRQILLDFGSVNDSYMGAKTIVDGYGPVAGVLRPLGALLSGTQDAGGDVYPLHSSVRDFLAEESRSRYFCVGSEESHHTSLASICLKVLQRDLYFNMAGLDNSHIPNNAVPDFDLRVRAGVSRALSYASRNWAKHIHSSKQLEEQFSETSLVYEVLDHLFLFWVEALALEKSTSDALSACQILAAWIKTPAWVTVVQQWSGFLRQFRSIAEEITPHLYVSALILWPHCRKMILRDFKGLTSVPESRLLGQAPFRGTIRGHGGIVYSTSFSHDGTKIVSSSSDKTIRIWDANSGSQIGQPLVGHTDTIYSVMFSLDDTLLVSASEDQTVRLWNAESREQIGRPLIGHNERVMSAAFSPDRKIVASGGRDKAIRLWDVHSRSPLREPLIGHEEWVDSVVFSPDGKCLASASYDYTIRIWDVASGLQVGEPLTGNRHYAHSVAFSPDGTRVVSASYDVSGSIRMWDVQTGSQVWVAGHDMMATSVAFSPDGTQVASAFISGKHVRIWDACTGAQVGQPLQPLTMHANSVESVAFSPDGLSIVAGSFDNAVHVWEHVTEPLPTTRRQLLLGSVASFSPDGAFIVSASADNALRKWSAHSGEQIGDPWVGHSGQVKYVVFSKDSARVVSASRDKTVMIWDAFSGVPVCPTISGVEWDITSVAFSPDGRRVVITLQNNSFPQRGPVKRPELYHKICVRDAESGAYICQDITGHDSNITAATFSPDGEQIVSAAVDKTVRVWDVESGTQIGEPFRGHTDSVLSAAYSPDGLRVVSASTDRTVRIWDAQLHVQSGIPLIGHDGRVNTAAFSSDGMRIVSGSDDRTVRIWDANLGVQLGLLTGHFGSVVTVAFSLNDCNIYSSSHDNFDNSLRLWGTQSVWAGSGHSSEPEYNAWLSSSVYDKGTGWILGGRKEHLLWIPQSLRQEHIPMWLPDHLHAFGGPELRIYWENSFQGTDWAQCYVGKRKKGEWAKGVAALDTVT